MVMTQGVRLPISALLSQAPNVLGLSSHSQEPSTSVIWAQAQDWALGCPDIKKKTFFIVVKYTEHEM